MAALVVIGTTALVLGAFAALAAWIRRRGVGHELMGPIDEIWHPAAQVTHVEAVEQQERVAPTPDASLPSRHAGAPRRE